QPNGKLPPIDLVAVQQGDLAVQAVSHARDEGRPFDLAFIDVRMPPGMNGLDTAAKIREIDDNLPIVIVTAYTDVQTVDLVERVPPAHRVFILQKPFHRIEIQQLAIALATRRDYDEKHRSAGQGRSGSAAEDLPAAVLRYLPGGLAIFDEEQRLVHASEELQRLFPDVKEPFKAGAAYRTLQVEIAGQFALDQIRMCRSKGKEESHAWSSDCGRPVSKRLIDNRWMLISEQSCSPGNTVVQFLDVTAQKEAEQRRAISHGMTHISRLANVLVDRLNSTSSRASVEQMAGIGTASCLTQELLSDLLPIAQRQDLEPKVAMPDALVAEAAARAKGRLHERLRLEVIASIGLWQIFIDPARAVAILQALIDNAAEAQPEAGSIELESTNVRISREAAADLPGLKAGDYVRIEVRDQGPGMSPELIERAVMPFFTSKDPRQHRGMGLTSAYSLVAQSGGLLDIESDGRSGTTVRIFLPRVITPAAMPKPNGRLG
ncbi:MAG TPA: ATP-binding protein, partial [Woeseiaceae bacterium]